jgi:hypothetical protein
MSELDFNSAEMPPDVTGGSIAELLSLLASMQDSKMPGMFDYDSGTPNGTNDCIYTLFEGVVIAAHQGQENIVPEDTLRVLPAFYKMLVGTGTPATDVMEFARSFMLHLGHDDLIPMFVETVS